MSARARPRPLSSRTALVDVVAGAQALRLDESGLRVLSQGAEVVVPVLGPARPSPERQLDAVLGAGAAAPPCIDAVHEVGEGHGAGDGDGPGDAEPQGGRP